MSPRTTGVMALVALALGAFLYFYEVGGEEGRRAAEEAGKRILPGFEASDVESGYLERAFGDLPVLGVMGAYQLGPARPGDGGESQLHTHAGVLAFVDG